MGDTNSTDSPLEATAGVAGPHATDAFALLGDETRLAILLALWDAYEPHAEHNAVSFSELRDRVGLRQGTQFNYHLDKLVGRFVRKTDDGYELRRPARMLVQSIIAGTGLEEVRVEPTEIDASCELCGASTAITYENNYVYQVCTDCQGESAPGDGHPSGLLTGWTFEPTGVSNRTAEELFAASTIKNLSRIVLRFENVCPECSGRVEWALDICDDHDSATDDPCPTCGRHRAIIARETCTVCKSSGQGTPGIKVLLHPAVIAFYYDRGIEIGFTGTTDVRDVIQMLKLVETFEEDVVSQDPPRVRVTAPHDDDELQLLLDERLNVVDTTANV